MPRRSSARRSRGRLRNPPQPASHTPPPAPVQNVGFVKGMAFGAGYAVANRIMGPRTIQRETVVIESADAAPADACNSHTKAFQDCLNSSGSDSSKCQFYIDLLNECRRNSGSMPSA